jgi:hypothetical protein
LNSEPAIIIKGNLVQVTLLEKKKPGLIEALELSSDDVLYFSVNQGKVF